MNSLIFWIDIHPNWLPFQCSTFPDLFNLLYGQWSWDQLTSGKVLGRLTSTVLWLDIDVCVSQSQPSDWRTFGGHLARTLAVNFHICVSHSQRSGDLGIFRSGMSTGVTTVLAMDIGVVDPASTSPWGGFSGAWAWAKALDAAATGQSRPQLLHGGDWQESVVWRK